MVIAPVCSIVETGENLGYLQPVVFDGVEYQRANLRRMGFDESRDPLYYYRIPKFMQTHKADTVPFHLLVEPIDIKKHYQVVGLQTFVSTSNTPYRVDSIMICDGSREDPMRFLDYSLIDIPMERARYEEKGKPARNEDHAKLDLNFLQGEARLDPSDTLNIRKLRDLRTNLSRYNGATSSIDGVVIHGSASPEGGMAVNERLCRERAEFIRQQLSSFPELQEVRSIGGIKTTHKVATWADVANLLESDSLKDEAASVRGILSIASDMQEAGRANPQASLLGLYQHVYIAASACSRYPVRLHHEPRKDQTGNLGTVSERPRLSCWQETAGIRVLPVAGHD